MVFYLDLDAWSSGVMAYIKKSFTDYVPRF